MLNEEADYNDYAYKEVFGCYSKQDWTKIWDLTSAVTVKYPTMTVIETNKWPCLWVQPNERNYSTM